MLSDALVQYQDEVSFNRHPTLSVRAHAMLFLGRFVNNLVEGGLVTESEIAEKACRFARDLGRADRGRPCEVSLIDELVSAAIQ